MLRSSKGTAERRDRVGHTHRAGEHRLRHSSETKGQGPSVKQDIPYENGNPQGSEQVPGQEGP